MILNWMESVLQKYPEEIEAKHELINLRDYFTSLTVTEQNYGLIHFDFEFDNLFFEESTSSFTPIDFDDSMYHWYAMDIERAVNSIKDEVPNDLLESSLDQFIQGYRNEYAISDEMLALLPIFERFANLYKYTRILHSIDEKWENEPDWLLNLRSKLEHYLENIKSNFSIKLSFMGIK